MPQLKSQKNRATKELIKNSPYTDSKPGEMHIDKGLNINGGQGRGRYNLLNGSNSRINKTVVYNKQNI